MKKDLDMKAFVNGQTYKANNILSNISIFDKEEYRVLVVDDDEINQKIMLNQLTTYGYKTDIASNGIEALKLIDKYPTEYDLAIIDVMMPNMSGYELSSEIRKTYTLFQLPILLLTAKTMVENIVTGFEAGANDYLSKPFETLELLARVKTLITLKRLVSNSIEKERELIEEQLNRKHAENYAKQQEKYNIKLNNTIAELNLAMAELSKTQEYLIQSEKISSLSQLFGGIIHNINTPIMSISGASYGLNELINEYHDGIGDDQLTEDDHREIAYEMNKWIKGIKDNLDYMSKVVSTVKGQIVKYNDRTLNYFSVDEVIERVKLLLEYQIKFSRCKMNIANKVNKDTEIKGEISCLIEIIDNLVMNSIQAYGNKGGNIDIEFYEEGNHIIISVSDKAGGISKDAQNKIFNEMITTKGRNGSGLGLYLAYSSIKARFSGDMRFKSDDGIGTTFYILIPKSD